MATRKSLTSLSVVAMIAATASAEPVCASSAAAKAGEGKRVAVRTFCNPLSIPDTPIGFYCRDCRDGDPIPEKGWLRGCWTGAACKFTEMHQYRELADPTVFAEGGTWYLYPSCGLMWTSDDCGGTWRHVPLQSRAGYAPTVAKFRGKYYFCDSGGALGVSDSPVGPFKTLGAFDRKSFSTDPSMPSTMDPALLADGDRFYLYWGIGKQLWGVELDPDNPTRAKTPGSAVCLVKFDTERHPCQNSLIEGSWAFRRGDTYYLTYATMGRGYCWCAMKSGNPLGPFAHQRNNPFFATPKGLVKWTGHGSIWCDANGDWWINHCVFVSAYNKLERMLAQDRLYFEPNGDIAVGTATDTPQWLPSSGRKGDTGWKPVPLRSGRPEATDGTLSTWAVLDSLPAECEFEFDGERVIESFRIIWRDIGLDTNRGVVPGPYRYRVECRANGRWRTWLDASNNETDLMVDYREAPETAADAVRLVVLSAPRGITPGLAELTVFGSGK